MIDLTKNFPSKYDVMFQKTYYKYSELHGLLKIYYKAKTDKLLSPNTLSQMGKDFNFKVIQHNNEVRRKVPYAKEFIIKYVFFYS